jgi:hypothetical protein
MNSQRCHILRRPTLQDLHRLRFTAQLFRKGITTHEFTNFSQWCYKESLSISIDDVNLGRRIIVFKLNSSITIVVTIAAIATVFVTPTWFIIFLLSSAFLFIFRRWCRNFNTFTLHLLLNQLKKHKDIKCQLRNIRDVESISKSFKPFQAWLEQFPSQIFFRLQTRTLAWIWPL